MKNIGDITEAIKVLLEDVSYFSDNNFTIERGTPPVTDPNFMPWIGIYRDSVKYNPRSLGIARVNTDTDNWSGLIRVVIMVKDHEVPNLEDAGADLEDAIELHIKNILDTVVGSRTLSDNVEDIKSIEVSYTYERMDEDDVTTMYMYGAVIFLDLEVITS